MTELLEKIAFCIEFGKINRLSPYPFDMKDRDGTDEYTQMALDLGVSAQAVLVHGLITGMERIGVKFRENKVFMPQVLMSAKAINTAMVHLEPTFFQDKLSQKAPF